MPSPRTRPWVHLGIGLLILGGGLVWWLRGAGGSAEVAAERDRLLRTGQAKADAVEVQGRRPARPRPPGQAHPKTGSAHDLYLRMLHGEDLEISRPEIDAYLTKNGRNAESLLAAYAVSGRNAEFLKEALERFPDHPQVLHLAIESEHDQEKRLALLQRFKANAPDNAMGNYLTANSLLKLGRTDEAVAEFLAGSGKKWSDHANEFVLNKDEIYLSAGNSEAGSKLISSYGQSAQSLLEMRGATSEIAKVAKAMAARGDQETAEALRAASREMAGQIREGAPSVVQQLVANVIEAGTYKEMGTSEAEAEVAAIRARGNALSSQAVAAGKLLENGTASEADIGSYMDRLRTLGEAKANAWLLQRYASPAP